MWPQAPWVKGSVSLQIWPTVGSSMSVSGVMCSLSVDSRALALTVSGVMCCHSLVCASFCVQQYAVHLHVFLYVLHALTGIIVYLPVQGH